MDDRDPAMPEGGRSLRVAVVGSGPAGFYAAADLLAARDVSIAVEMYERLPTPWGLVRAGVAPDHPKIKSVSRVFEKIAAHPRFHLLGNVEIGRDLTHDELLEHHHAVIYATGSPIDRRLGIPGETLRGSIAATDFVGWYNGHPDFADLQVDLDGRTAVVVGNGNVALDVARMLALTRAELAVTDVADHALEALAASSIEEIVVIGRRGPAQAAYTTPELRELADLEACDVLVDPADARLDPLSAAAMEAPDADPGQRRNCEVVAEYARRTPTGRPRTLRLRFLLSPVELLGDDRVAAVRVVHNRLVAGPDGSLRAEPTGVEETIATQLVFRSVGYRGEPFAGLPFDDRRAVIRNLDGRVLADDGTPLAGVYVAGWVKRGPTGVIGTNKKDAHDTVALLLEDAAAGRLDRAVVTTAARRLDERAVAVVDHPAWERIDRHERAAGEPLGRPRVKVTRVDELLHIAGAGGQVPVDG